MYDLSDALPGALTAARKEIIAQRKEIIALLRMLGQSANPETSGPYPKWIRDRLTALGEEV